MNKAFTANINDQVTARGYLDENDQLIMLEPDMSGGGDDDESLFSDFDFTFVNNTAEDIIVNDFLYSDGELAKSKTVAGNETAQFSIVAINGEATYYATGIPKGATVNIDGPHELKPNTSNEYIITGAVTITVTAAPVGE